MSIFLDTRGKSTLGIGVCDRCSKKRSLTELVSDPNSPGLRVCRDGCRDEYDPWRLPARQTEDIHLRHPRPDVSIAVTAEQAAEDMVITDRGFVPPGES